MLYHSCALIGSLETNKQTNKQKNKQTKTAPEDMSQV